eukprot:scaffold5_cov169-Amphora_coffeaeformis.AAC.19
MGGTTSSPKPITTTPDERVPMSKGSTLTSTTSSYGSVQSNCDVADVEEQQDHDAIDELPKENIPSHVANMTNSIIGGGVLSLPGGIAMYAATQQSHNNKDLTLECCLTAVAWVMFLGATFGYFCHLIARCCVPTRSASYRDCWEGTVGKGRGSLVVAVANTLDPLLGIFANASIVAQSLRLLLQGVVEIYWTQVHCLLVVTLVAFLPLCLLKNLKALVPLSVLGTAAVIGALVAMSVRYLDGSYRQGGYYYDDLPPSLQFQSEGDSSEVSTHHRDAMAILPFVSMVYTSFDMHYNSPRFYAELRNPTLPRFGKAVAYSFGLTAVLYAAIAVVGFSTFGTNSQSFILNNYSSKDPLATWSRIGVGLSSLLTYPLNFIGVRDNCLDILGIAPRVDTDAKRNAFTVVLLAMITFLSCFISDLGLINTFGGGTTVASVCFVFPTIMFFNHVRVEANAHGELRKPAYQRQFNVPNFIQQYGELTIVMVLMVVGVVVGVLGAWHSVMEQPNAV